MCLREEAVSRSRLRNEPAVGIIPPELYKTIIQILKDLMEKVKNMHEEMRNVSKGIGTIK